MLDYIYIYLMGRSAKEGDGIETGPNSLLQWAGIVGLAGMIIWWVVMTVLGLMWPKYSAVSDPGSLLASVGAPYAGVMQLNFYVFGASVLIFTLGLLVFTNRGWRLLLGGALLVVFGTGVILAGYFPYDPNNLESMTTRYHDMISVLTFLSAILAISITSWGLNHDDQWPNYRNRFVPLGIAGLAIGSLVVYRSVAMTPLEGLGQRLFLLVLTGWVAYHANGLRTLTRDGGRTEIVQTESPGQS